jgi:hypothetical protein
MCWKTVCRWYLCQFVKSTPLPVGVSCSKRAESNYAVTHPPLTVLLNLVSLLPDYFVLYWSGCNTSYPRRDYVSVFTSAFLLLSYNLPVTVLICDVYVVFFLYSYPFQILDFSLRPNSRIDLYNFSLFSVLLFLNSLKHSVDYTSVPPLYHWNKNAFCV